MTRVKERQVSSGFTLIEVLLVIAILAILAAIVIVAINPAKQFAEAQNAQRRSDVRSIIEAVHQYAVDNYGSYPGDIVSGTDCETDGANICKEGVSCEGVNIDALLVEQKYLTTIPADPTVGTDQITGYKIFENGNGRIGVCAPAAYGDVEIGVLQ